MVYSDKFKESKQQKYLFKNWTHAGFSIFGIEVIGS